MVFFSTCDAVDFHYSLLSKFQLSPYSQPEAELKQFFLKCKTFRLHGNMKQEDRRSTVGAFKTEKLALLLSTDVAARGLDFPKVRCIIQYDSPGEATEYVHRYFFCVFPVEFLYYHFFLPLATALSQSSQKSIFYLPMKTDLFCYLIQTCNSLGWS